jgi:Activator of Hsp90 ATPase homolog 1-like protein
MVAFSLLQILYRAITEVGNLAHWWTAGVRGRSKVAEQLEFWFGNFCASLVEVQQLSVNQLVQWLVTGGGATDWIDTRVEFKIFSEDGKTFLHFRHSDWQADAKTFPHCSMGWAIFLLSLKEFA